MTFFRDWLERPASHGRPLLLVAPFGLGKSVALAQFTLALAEDLQVWCEGTRGTGPLPWVPFPVRLREWSTDQHLWDYMVGAAQADINPLTLPADRLTPAEVLHVGRAGRLLPLFDGLDELADGGQRGCRGIAPRTDAVRQILGNPFFGRRHVISSRPEHGAESGGYAEHAAVYTIRPLDDAAAESYIRKRLRTSPDLRGRVALSQLHTSRAAIGELFRRPLFLAAWCDRAAAWLERPDLVHLPMTASGLMEAVLERVLDQRMSDRREGADGDRDAAWAELLDNRHRLGAVLAIHADVGFGVRAANAGRDVGRHPHAFADVAQYRRYEGAARKAGLLIGASGGSYVEKIPVVEYLIGCYYAWLAGHRPADSPEAPRRQMVDWFQRRFCWPDHEEVWGYAFDILWAGDESQRLLAGGIVGWVLELSKWSIGATNWSGPLFAGQTCWDRTVWSFAPFVLRALLPPAGTASPAARGTIDGLIGRAMAQLQDEVVGFTDWWWPEAESLEGVGRRHPRELAAWLLGWLADPSRHDQSAAIIDRITEVAPHLGPAAAAQLVRHLGERERPRRKWRLADAVVGMARHLGLHAIPELIEALRTNSADYFHDLVGEALGEMARHSGAVAMEHLLGLLEDPTQQLAWKPVAAAVRTASCHLTLDAYPRIFQLLGSAAHVGVSETLALALGEAASHIGPAAASFLLQRLRPVSDYDQDLVIALAVRGAATHLGPDAIDSLLYRLESLEHPRARPWLALTLRDAAKHLRPPDVARLLALLNEPRMRSSGSYVASAIGEAARLLGADMDAELLSRLGDAFIAVALRGVATRLDELALSQLLRRLDNAGGCGMACDIAEVLFLAASHLGPDAVDQLLRHLGDPRYECAWQPIAKVVAEASVHLGPEPLVRLLSHLDRVWSAGAWDSIGRALRLAQPQLGSAEMSPLLVWLRERKYCEQEVCWWKLVAPAMGGIGAQLGPEGTVQLLDHLDDNHHEQVWVEIAAVIGRAAENDVCRGLVKRRVEAALAAGRIAFAKRVVSAVAGLVIFVRDVRPDADPGRRIVYGIAERDDAELLLPADRRFAPLEIRRLLGTLTTQEETRDAGSPGDWQRKKEAMDVVLEVVGQYYEKHAEIKAFKKALGSVSTRYKKLEKIILPEVRLGLGLQEEALLWRWREKSERSTTHGAEPRSDGSEAHSQLEINLGVLRRVKDGKYQGLVEKIYNKIVNERGPTVHWMRLKNPVVICPDCGCIHRLIKPDGTAGATSGGAHRKKPSRPKQPHIPRCKMCEEPFELLPDVQEHPIPYLKCLNDDRHTYAMPSAEGQWRKRPSAMECYSKAEPCRVARMTELRAVASPPVDRKGPGWL